MRYLVLTFALFVAQGFSPVMAQTAPPDPFQTARFRIGPLAMTPKIAITDVGIDTNVLNEWTDPKQDFTATLNPGADMWLRMGKARISAKGGLGFQYFAKYAGQRGVTTNDSVRLEVPFVHLRPWASVSYVNSRERYGYELDVRARRQEHHQAGGLDFLVSPRTTLGVAIRHSTIGYATDAEFLGNSLRDSFNRDVQGGGASVRYKLTPLTTFVANADFERDRFEFSPLRNSNRVRVVPGLELDTAALIDGSISVGYTKFDMISPLVPDYEGVVAVGNLGYTLLGVTRFSVQVQRDLTYSYELQQPYYVQTGAILTITQRVAGPFDLQARGGRQYLDYRSVSGAEVAEGRRDVVTTYGGGIGYRIGRSARLGFNVDSYRRRSPAVSREFTGTRFGTSLTYGY